jgi:hypothetical protein
MITHTEGENFKGKLAMQKNHTEHFLIARVSLDRQPWQRVLTRAVVYMTVVLLFLYVFPFLCFHTAFYC